MVVWIFILLCTHLRSRCQGIAIVCQFCQSVSFWDNTCKKLPPQKQSFSILCQLQLLFMIKHLSVAELSICGLWFSNYTVVQPLCMDMKWHQGNTYSIKTVPLLGLIKRIHELLTGTPVLRYLREQGFEVRNNIATTLNVCIASFKTIGKLQRETEIVSVTCHSI